jgi:chromosome segregation ATPase
MSVALQVCIRCRPFAHDDSLGVVIRSNADGGGDEVELLSEDGDGMGRFGFSRAWWSAAGYEKHTNSRDQALVAQNSPGSVSQEDVYRQVGSTMKEQFLGGHAVVMFAYGLSGSGKTYSVFGPDMIGLPEAWFNFDEPHRDWGVFPRLAHDIMQTEATSRRKGQPWKITMKYFQNVVDRILDLLSDGGDQSKQTAPGRERQSHRRGKTSDVEDRHISEGFHQDKHGFVDITWCRKLHVTSWHELRVAFKGANARKAIAPTQFNHASTRGHCILVFEAKMPHPQQEGVSRTGRLYVCDLAGAEPAAEVHCAQYERVVDPNSGAVEYNYKGRHPDNARTDELVNQGKKINLSLSEMTGFFRQMAKLIKRKKFNPNRPIPGCRTYFLGKFLKNTLMHAQTYLFAAIRPELQYQTFTEATLRFATNASIVKLRPRKMDSHTGPALLPVAGGEKSAKNDLHGLWAMENTPDSLRDKLDVMHDLNAGRRPLAEEQRVRMEALVQSLATSQPLVPDDILRVLQSMVSEDAPPTPSAVVLSVVRRSLLNGVDDGSKKIAAADFGVLGDASEIQREATRISDFLRGDRLTNEDREKCIDVFETEDDGHVREERRKQPHLAGSASSTSAAALAAAGTGVGTPTEKKKKRRHRMSTLTTSAANLLFDLDHQRMAASHAVMLCAGKSSLEAVVKIKKDHPPTHDDTEIFEEAAISGSDHCWSPVEMSLRLLSDIVQLRRSLELARAEIAENADKAISQDDYDACLGRAAHAESQLQSQERKHLDATAEADGAHETALGALRDRIAEMAELLAASEKEHKQLKASVQEKDVKMQALDEERVRLKGALVEADRQSIQTKEKHCAVILDFRNRTKKDTSDLEASKKQNEDLDATIKAKDAQIQELRTSQERLSEALSQAQNTSEHVTLELEKCQRELSMVQLDTKNMQAEAEREADQGAAKRERLEADLSRAQGLMAMKEEQLQKATKATTELGRKAGEERDRLMGQLRAEKEQSSTLAREVREGKRRERELSETMVDLKESVAELASQIEESKEDADAAETNASKLGDALSAAKEELDVLKRNVLTLEKKKMLLETGLEKEKETRAQMEVEHKTEVSELNSSLAKLNATVTETAAARTKETLALREELRAEVRLRSEGEASLQEVQHSAEGLRFEIDQQSDQIVFLMNQLEAAAKDEKKASDLARADKASLTQQLQEARRDLRQESKTRAEAEATLRRTAQAFKEAKDVRDAALSEVSDWKARLELTEKDRNQERNDHAEKLAANRETITAEITSLRQRAVDAEAIAAKNGSLLDASTDREQQAADAMSEMREKAESARAETRTMREKCTALERDLAASKREKDRLFEKCDATNGHVDSLEKTVSSLEAQVDAAELALQKAKYDVGRLTKGQEDDKRAYFEGKKVLEATLTKARDELAARDAAAIDWEAERIAVSAGARFAAAVFTVVSSFTVAVVGLLCLDRVPFKFYSRVPCAHFIIVGPDGLCIFIRRDAIVVVSKRRAIKEARGSGCFDGCRTTRIARRS